MAEKRRTVYFDLLNICACFCVVWLHNNGIVHQFTNSAAWKQSLVVETIAYWAVPIFFMLTGATLMRYRERYDTKTFFKKRLCKVFVPFLVWSVIMLIYKSWRGTFVLTDFSFQNLATVFLNNQMQSVYWFFFPLFAIYASMPVLSLLSGQRKWLWYMVGLSFVTQACCPLLCKLAGIQWNAALAFPMTGGHLIYPILGYLLSTEDLSFKKRIAIYLAGAGAVVLRYTATYFLSMRDGETNRTFFGYNYFTAVLLGVAVFVLFKHIKLDWLTKREKLCKALSVISSCSFGVYLIHVIIKESLLRLTGLDPHRLLWRTVCALAVYLISLAIILILKKIPILKRLVP